MPNKGTPPRSALPASGRATHLALSGVLYQRCSRDSARLSPAAIRIMTVRGPLRLLATAMTGALVVQGARKATALAVMPVNPVPMLSSLGCRA